MNKPGRLLISVRSIRRGPSYQRSVTFTLSLTYQDRDGSTYGITVVGCRASVSRNGSMNWFTPALLRPLGGHRRIALVTSDLHNLVRNALLSSKTIQDLLRGVK